MSSICSFYNIVDKSRKDIENSISKLIVKPLIYDQVANIKDGDNNNPFEKNVFTKTSIDLSSI